MLDMSRRIVRNGFNPQLQARFSNRPSPSPRKSGKACLQSSTSLRCFLMHQLTITSRELCQRQKTVSCAVQTSSVKVCLAVGVGQWISRANSGANSPSGLPTVFVPTVLLGTRIESHIPESILSGCSALLSHLTSILPCREKNCCCHGIWIVFSVA